MPFRPGFQEAQDWSPSPPPYDRSYDSEGLEEYFLTGVSTLFLYGVDSCPLTIICTGVLLNFYIDRLCVMYNTCITCRLRSLTDSFTLYGDIIFLHPKGIRECNVQIQYSRENAWLKTFGPQIVVLLLLLCIIDILPLQIIMCTRDTVILTGICE